MAGEVRPIAAVLPLASLPLCSAQDTGGERGSAPIGLGPLQRSFGLPPTHPVHGLTPISPRDREAVIEQRYDVPGAPAGARPIVLRGARCHIERFERLLATVAQTAIGRETLIAIARTPHTLIIEHSANALSTSGKSLTVMTRNTTNGVGTNVTIQMDLRVPDTGSHLVAAIGGGTIGFPPDVILAHELSHARRDMQGGALHVFDRERDAIIDENVYRMQIAELRGDPVTQREASAYEDDEQVWRPGPDQALCSCAAPRQTNGP